VSTSPSQRTRSRTRPKRASGALPLVGLVVAIIGLAGAAIGIAALDRPQGRNGGPGSEAETAVAMPIMNIPQTVAGVRVIEPAVDRGPLPLNQTVSQSYELMNTGNDTVRLGQPTIEVLDGCCPPEPTLDRQVLQPGQTATVSMSMQMHPGMDGPHLFHLAVPVGDQDATDALHLYFKGDFGG
jgi:hypothetical protein